jgi:hypothetical protein
MYIARVEITLFMLGIICEFNDIPFFVHTQIVVGLRSEYDIIYFKVIKESDVTNTLYTG